jgi:Conserved hypothetical protein (DUF2461)
MTATFDGWPAEALSVLAEIAADNRADLWPELRDRHAAAVRGPTVALAAELAAEFGPVRVLRPHVSRRFRPDAPPLRTDTGGVAASENGGTLAFLLSPAHLTVTAGHWRFDRAQLLRYRAAVAGEEPPGLAVADLAESACSSQSPCEERGGVDAGAELAQVLAQLGADAMLPDPDGELRGTPRGWRSGHPRIALARRRGLQVVRRWEVGPWISTTEPLERIRTAWRAAGPLMEWLDTHVGAAEADRPPAARELSAANSPG